MIGAFQPHPLCITFGEAECCALRHAMENQHHRAFVDGFTKEAEKSFPPHVASALKEIFIKTTRLRFIPAPVHRVFYSELAELEIKFLEDSSHAVLPCGHKREQHAGSLEKIRGWMRIYSGSSN